MAVAPANHKLCFLLMAASSVVLIFEQGSVVAIYEQNPRKR